MAECALLCFPSNPHGLLTLSKLQGSYWLPVKARGHPNSQGESWGSPKVLLSLSSSEYYSLHPFISTFCLDLLIAVPLKSSKKEKKNTNFYVSLIIFLIIISLSSLLGLVTKPDHRNPGVRSKKLSHIPCLAPSGTGRNDSFFSCLNFLPGRRVRVYIWTLRHDFRTSDLKGPQG